MTVITIRLAISQVSSADSSYPGVNEELYKAVRRVLLGLDALTDLLLTPGGPGEDDPQLRLLQQEVTDRHASQAHIYSITYRTACAIYSI